jgi:hypothetical protein
MKKSIWLVLAVAVAAVAAVVSTTAASAARSGELHVTKECSEYDGTAGSFCTITSSNISAIKTGMRVVYLEPQTAAGLDSDIVLSLEHGSAASGHVVLNATTARVTFSGGTGKFGAFQADVAVTVDSKGVWHWDGTYSFTRSDDD